MVDSTDLVILTSIVQTVVITATLAVFIFQFRSQERATKESAVQSVMGRYTDYIRMLVEKPELTKLLNQPEGLGPDRELSPEDQILSAYLLLGYGIFEEVYGLYKKKWMDEETWKQWSSFLERMSQQPLFQRVHGFTAGTFDKDFEDYVATLIEQSKGRPPDGVG